MEVNTMKRIKGLTLAGIFTATTVLPTFAAEKPEVTVLSLADNIYGINLMGYTSLVVIGDKGVLISDTANPTRAALLKEEIAKLTRKPVDKIVLSHEHFDHVGGTEIFESANIYAQENIRDDMQLDPFSFLPNDVHYTYKNKMTIDLGNTKVDLVHVAVADGEATTVVHLPKEKIAMSADLYRAKGFSRVGSLTNNNKLGNRETLNEMASWNLKHSVNGHSKNTDPVMLSLGAELLNDIHDAIYPKAQEYLNSGGGRANRMKLFAFADNLSLPKYKDWDNYENLGIYARKMASDLTHGG